MAEDLGRIRAEAVARGSGLPAVPSRLDRWRRENPDAVSSWETKHGCVVVFWGMKVYYGRCKDCGSLVHTSRSADTPGRWPETCTACQERKQQAHDDKARHRMRKARTKYGPANDLRRYNGAHHHKDDDEFGIPSAAEDVDHWDPRHRPSQSSTGGPRHQRTAPEDYPRGTTPGTMGQF